MEPLPIAVMHIDTYNIEESPLHQIVKKLVYRKILDLEPYNFNYIYGGSNGLGEKIYGNFSNTYDADKQYSYYNESKRKATEEKINLDRMRAMMNQGNIEDKLDQNEDLAELRAETSLEKQEMANEAREKLAGIKTRTNGRSN